MTAFPYPHPQPTNNTLAFGDSIGNDVSVTIYTKQRWADAWAADATLDLLFVSWNAAPNIPTATIRYRYGRAVEQGANVETTRTKKTWLGHYVKIVAVCSDGNRVWHGFVDDLADEQGGFVSRIVPGDPPTVVHDATGVQTLSCVGMIAALDRAPMERTYQRVGANFAFAGSTTRVAWSAPQFNVAEHKAENGGQFGGLQLAKSRTSTTELAPGFGISNQVRNVYTHVFPGLYGIVQATQPDAWRLGDVLENLVAFNAPRVGVGTQFAPLADVQDPDYFRTAYVPVWIFDHDVLNPPNTTTQFADWFLPRLDCEGLTLKGALDRLLAPQNGHGYWVWVDETNTPNRVYVEPFTTITTAATIKDENGNNQTFPANTRVVNLTAATDSATAISVQSNGAQQYTALVVSGAPKLVVLTIDTINQLEPAWPQSLDDAYNAEIAGLNPAIMRQLQRMRDIRELPRYQPIGRHWRIKHVYNWQDSIPAADVFQYDEPNADPLFVNATPARYLPFGGRLRLLSELPLREGIDYAAANTATVKTNHEAARTPWRRAEVYAKTHEADATLTGKWNCWSTKAVRDVLYDPNDPTYGIQTRELTNQMAVGLEIEVTGGYQGALAAGGGRVAPHVPKIDPAELRITVAAQSDQLAQVIERNPATVTQPVEQTLGTVNIDADRVKTIRLGDRFQNVVVMKDTIVGVSEAGPVTVPARFVLRDDTPLAAQFAKFAANYYFQPRSIVRVVSRRATAKLWPGQMIGTVNANTPHAATCNAQVSEVSLTMGVGVGGNYTAPTFTVQTSFGELDPLQFFPKLTGG